MTLPGLPVLGSSGGNIEYSTPSSSKIKVGNALFVMFMLTLKADASYSNLPQSTSTNFTF